MDGQAMSQRATGEELIDMLPRPPLPRLTPRRQDAHKGDFGHALLIGGSRGMAGAIALAGMSASQAGAGLVRLAVPDRCLETVAGFSPCPMTIPLLEDSQGRIALAALEALQERLPSATCIAIGPGLGRSRELQTLLRRLLSLATCPLVIDADGLNNLADLSDWSARVAFRPVVLTPHPGEWQRLCGVPASDRRAQSAAAIDLARQTGIAVVLKGSQTLVTDGDTVVLNDSGTPAMATGGSGDVLTGLITALICQGLAVRDAAHLGVHVHGRAAEIAAQQLQTHVVLPTQLIAHLPQAFRAAQRGTLAGN